ncbi:DNA-binding protein HU-beta [Humidesulfovibrio mexicanus]|uniref:DNA-binding protein HU-beta n=1 Tax=Humidesulfovibrio mexicanus TaxID=147047 RepID=A0A239BEZ5_9BACT|nr:HU family DNA-binding protein [Humidesulfovibrio mexicanus]SNS06192.1 DNA-binding protein HU-beta [Humidesulfovibrio mexicanus]
MTKKDLIAKIAEESGDSKATVERVLDSLGSVAAAELLGGGEVPLPGLGKLKAKECKAREGRNPKTGQPLQIAAHTAVKFVAGQELKDALKG